MALVSGSILVDILLALVLACYILYWFITNNDDYWKKRGVPHIRTGLIWTNFLGKKSQGEVVHDLYKRFSQEKYFGFFQLRQPVLMLNDLELIHRVLVKDFTHFQDRGQPKNDKDLFSKNLFNLRGQLWRSMRYKLTPTFTTGKLKGMFDQVSNCGENMIRKIEDLSNQNTDVDSKDFLFEFTSEVISSCAFGLQFEPNSREFAMFKSIVQNMFKPSHTVIFKFIIILLFPKLAEILNFSTFVSKDAGNYFLNLIKSTSQYREENNIKRNDYLQMLLTLKEQEDNGQDMGLSTADVSEDDAVIDQMKYTEHNSHVQHSNIKLFTDDSICANSVIFLVAGSESTSGTISLALFELARHPNIQQKLQQEIDSVLAVHGGWSFQALKEMTFLDQVIQEAQRLFPLLPFLMRECTKTYKVPGSDLVIEEGTLISIPVISLHKDPQYYPEPELFKPERFEGNNFKPSPTFLPFGDGPRICIAMRFAVMEMKTSIARIMANYTIKLSPKTELPLKLSARSFVPRAEKGIWLTFEKREK